MQIKPVNGRILVKPVEGKDKTTGGIYIPDTAKEKLHEAEVIAIAEDATDELVAGDHIIYKEYSGTEVNIKGEDYVLLTEDDILAKYTTVDKIPE